jgi:GAF domain-containing protein
VTEARIDTSADDAHATVDEQLEFERFVAELSYHFINLPGDQVNEAIRAGLGVICQQMALDRSTFYNLEPVGALASPISWTADGFSPLHSAVTPRTQFPWTIERILAGELLAFSTLDEIPCDIDRGNYRAIETKSAVTIPLSVDDHVVGAIVFDTVEQERTWPPHVRRQLTVIGNVFGQVLGRQRKDQRVWRWPRSVRRTRGAGPAEPRISGQVAIGLGPVFQNQFHGPRRRKLLRP